MKKSLDEGIQKPQFEYACPYCGNVFYSYGQNGAICTFCNLLVDKGESEIAGDPLFDELKKANASISQLKEYDLSSLESMVSAKGDPAHTYGLAILYLKMSDIKYTKKNYALGGFMEDNAKNEEEAHALYSKAKLLLYDALAACEKNVASSQPLDYIAFLAEIALHEFGKAHKHLEALEGTNSIAAQFAKMLYAIEIGDKKAHAYAEALIKSGEVAGYFELGRLYAKTGKLNKAIDILSFLEKNTISMPHSSILLKKIKTFE
ncbi:MAG: hypothetical protein ACP5P2_03235 [Candidatus Micrarchaeia archaeon]|jgi:hypothetical protein